MKLIELKPQFLVIVEPGKRYNHIDHLQVAQGVRFECPVCPDEKSHSVLVWFANRDVPEVETPGPGRWSVGSASTDLKNLTLTPSIHLDCWHGHITDGNVT